MPICLGLMLLFSKAKSFLLAAEAFLFRAKPFFFAAEAFFFRAKPFFPERKHFLQSKTIFLRSGKQSSDKPFSSGSGCTCCRQNHFSFGAKPFCCSIQTLLFLRQPQHAPNRKAVWLSSRQPIFIADAFLPLREFRRQCFVDLGAVLESVSSNSVSRMVRVTFSIFA